MTVKELIEKLQKFDLQKQVLICGHDWTQETAFAEDNDCIYITQTDWL